MRSFGRTSVVVTGMGVLAPNGRTLDEFWQSNLSGRSGIDYISLFDTSHFAVKVAGEVTGFDPADYLPPVVYRKMDRFAQFGVCATQMALKDAALRIDEENPSRIGVVIGTGLGGILFHEQQIINVMCNGGPSNIVASAVPKVSPNAVSGHVAIHFGAKGPNYAVSTACSSGTNAIGTALLLLRAGMVDACIAGGVEAPLTPVTVAGYQALKCLSRKNHDPARVSAPFDRTRDGFVIGEGAGILVLETLEHAEARRARVYAELAGYGTNCGAYNMVAPQPDGGDVADAIGLCLSDAGITSDAIDYVNAHGTGTPYNDVAETRALKIVFGRRAYEIPISSTKSMIGHTIGAAGAIEAIVSVLALRSQSIPPTINLTTPDPECDLDYVPNCSRTARLRAVISNSCGFGSNNAVLMFTAMN